MNRRTLGKGGLEIGEIGLGCWQLGGEDFGPLAEETAQEILATARDCGTDFLDTANVYGAGRSESLIGRFLAEQEDRIVVATKTGRGEVYPDQYSRENLRTSIEDSLERLGVDCLDLVQLHCVPHEVLVDGAIFDWLRDLRSEGLIKHFGASVETVEEGLTCLGVEGLLSLQVIFNPFRQKLVKELLPQAAEAGVGIIVRLPLASGLLSGKYSVDTTFGDGDHRTYNRDGARFNVGETFAGLPFAKGVVLAEEMKEELPEGLSLPRMTLRWILDHEAVSVVIPGATNPAQARANAAASDLPPLSRELHEWMTRFYEEKVHSHVRGAY